MRLHDFTAERQPKAHAALLDAIHLGLWHGLDADADGHAERTRLVTKRDNTASCGVCRAYQQTYGRVDAPPRCVIRDCAADSFGTSPLRSGASIPLRAS